MKTLVPGNLQMIYRPSALNTMRMVTDTRLGGISLASQLLKSTTSALLSMVKHFENTVVTV